MKRPIKAGLGIVLVALAVPTAALATHRDGHAFGHDHRFQTGQTASGGSATSVSSFEQTSGALTLALGGGGTISGSVNYATHVVCLGAWHHFFFPHGRRRLGRGHRHTTKLTRGYFRHDNTGDTGDTGSTGSTAGTGSTGGYGHDRHPHGDGDGGSPTRFERCDASLLVPGVSIERADIAITSQGALFTDIVLLPAVQ